MERTDGYGQGRDIGESNGDDGVIIVGKFAVVFCFFLFILQTVVVTVFVYFLRL